MQTLVAQNVRDHRGVAETETQEGEAGKTAGAEAGSMSEIEMCG